MLLRHLVLLLVTVSSTHPQLLATTASINTKGTSTDQQNEHDLVKQGRDTYGPPQDQGYSSRPHRRTEKRKQSVVQPLMRTVNDEVQEEYAVKTHLHEHSDPHIHIAQPSMRSKDYHRQSSNTRHYVVDRRGDVDAYTVVHDPVGQLAEKQHVAEWGDWMEAQKSLHAPLADCVWGNWTEEGSCSVTCGGGSVQQRRKIYTEAQGGGRPCLGCEEQVVACNVDACPTPTTSTSLALNGPGGANGTNPRSTNPAGGVSSGTLGETSTTHNGATTGDDEGWTDAAPAKDRGASRHSAHGLSFGFVFGICLLVFLQHSC